MADGELVDICSEPTEVFELFRHFPIHEEPSHLPARLLELFERVGVDATFHPAIGDDASPAVRTKNCLVIFGADAVEMNWQNQYQIGYDSNTLKSVLSDFVPDAARFTEGTE